MSKQYNQFNLKIERSGDECKWVTLTDNLTHACIGFTRIGRHKVGDYAFHECFYDENGKVVLWGESSPHGETADDLIEDLEQMLTDVLDCVYKVLPYRDAGGLVKRWTAWPN